MKRFEAPAVPPRLVLLPHEPHCMFNSIRVHPMTVTITTYRFRLPIYWSAMARHGERNGNVGPLIPAGGTPSILRCSGSVQRNYLTR
jgi:hypothetical protein